MIAHSVRAGNHISRASARRYIMLVGILADTHDNLEKVDAALRTLNAKGVDLVLHAGDYVSPFVIPRFADLQSPMIGVLGNNDGDHRLLQRRFDEHDQLSLRGRFACVSAGDLAIGLLHGDEQELLEVLIRRKTFDVIVHGHTHQVAVSRLSGTLIINPGEACGYLTGRSTIAVLDTVTRNVELLTPGHEGP